MARELRELIRKLVFLGFNSRVVALDRQTGEIVWQWKSRQGTADYVALLLDDDRLVVSVQGYTYCLDPLTGKEMWFNPLKGFGLGIPTAVSANGSSSGAPAAEVVARQRAASESSTMHSGTSG
jgi:outer membrane protein assembly factor BamB